MSSGLTTGRESEAAALRSEWLTWVVLGRSASGVTAALLDAEGLERERVPVTASALPAWVAVIEADAAPRWVWNDSARWYPDLVEGGTQVSRCHDLRLAHLILRDSVLAPDFSERSGAAAAAPDAARWAAPPFAGAREAGQALFRSGGCCGDP